MTVAPSTNNNASTRVLQDELLNEVFERQANDRPDAPALECAGEILTYAELDRRANQTAHYLRTLGAGPGAYVAFQLPRSNNVLITLLAILKTGAAYVGLDTEQPPERVAYVLEDCGAKLFITAAPSEKRGQAPSPRDANEQGVVSDQALPVNDGCENGASPRFPYLEGCRFLEWEVLEQESRACSTERLSRLDTGVTPHDVCYVIYTSGSTGRPKGVQVEHRSVCHLVHMEQQLFAVHPEDRVYHGMSVAFDASVEEVWLALAVGATLVVATDDMAHSGPALPGLLTEAGVTILSCVPTLLSLFEDDLPTVRLLIVGGEPCPQDLVCRWSRPERRMVNTYGPTEATVIATAGDCLPDKPVTIGRALPGYEVYLLGEDLQPVPIGTPGEICIGGIGVARGYIGRPELTSERFLMNPFGSGRLYRTGDRGRFTTEGEIEFLGRMDTQVKLRGYRIELSEIENALMTCPEVGAAAVTVREDQPGLQQLVGYVIPRNGTIPEEESLLARLRDRLPVYMVPSFIEYVTWLPTLASGKVDRKHLPPPAERHAPAPAEDDAPRTPFELRLMEACEPFFTPVPVSRHADFFRDLGGHSLLAARVVSVLRKDPDFSDLSVFDLYHFPRLCDLAAEIEKRRQWNAAPDQQCDADEIPEPRSQALCGLGQVGGLYALMALIGVEWLLPFYVFLWMDGRGATLGQELWAVAGVLAVTFPGLLLFSVAVKWLLIGRYTAGRYPLWGGFYLRWWVATRVMSLAPVHYLAGTPFLNFYLRLMGAHIGEDAFIGTEHLGAFDLITIGAGSSVGQESSLLGYSIAGGSLIIGPITVGSGCYLGARSVVGVGGLMEDGARLEVMSLLPDGERIPAGQTWVGSPARPLPNPQTLRSEVKSQRSEVASRKVAVAVAHLVGILLLPIIPVAAAAPGIGVWALFRDQLTGFQALVEVPVMAVLYVLTFLLSIALLKWVLLGRVRAGVYALDSWFYARKRFVDQLLDLNLVVLGPVYATLYIAPFLRLLGAKLGPTVEVSTAHAVTPDLLQMSPGSFIADSVALGVAHVEGGTITLGQTSIGQRTFIGNSATLPGGSTVADNGLIGVLSTQPLSRPGAEQPGTAWLGSPSFFLPHRQINTSFSETTTYAPTAKLYAQRLAIEFLRITLPIMFTLILMVSVYLGVEKTQNSLSVLTVFALFPIIYMLCGIIAGGIVVATKWLLMGRFRPTEQPLWSTFVWKNELLTAMHEHLADPFLERLLLGTPFAPWFFRALGAKIGKRAYMETTSITEFDLVTIGDDVALNQDSVVQTHLFEDRVQKMSTINIGDGCTVGTRAIVLYDTVIERGATLGDLSLVMKGESLPAGTDWVGSPGRLMRKRNQVPFHDQSGQ